MQLTSETELISPSVGKHRKGRSHSRTNYYVIVSVVALAIVLGGFTLTYILPMTTSSTFSLRPMVHIHGLMYFAWMFLFILQPVLVRIGKTDLHRKIGVAGFVLAGGMVVIGLMTAITGAKLNSPALIVGGLTAKQFLIIPISDMILFTLYLGLSSGNLKNSEAHKRLMILATLAVIPAAVGRIAGILEISNLVIILLIQHGILYAGVIYDLVTRKKIHPVYIWGGLLLVVVHLVRFPMAATHWWGSIANWLVE
jgi:hypothetical protein